MQTIIIDNVFTDAIDAAKLRFILDCTSYVKRLWGAKLSIYKILKNTKGFEDARSN